MREAATGTEDGSSTGQFTLDAVLAVFDDRSDPARPLTANDVMDEIGCSRRTAHNKLNELVEQGRLATRKVGARGRVWWVPMDAPRAGDRPEPGDHAQPVQREITSVDLPGEGDRLAARREALRAAYDYLNENPDASETEVITEVFPDYPAGYDTADKWWDVIKPALKELPDVEMDTDPEHVWHYIGG
ncbi:helix-turn-helix transcriptional regulator [Haloarcula salina]|uniref:Helix-turn-helix domain-containing protein n=1 Tax=Haloarcula salina TaxID=1429914 RepID=A0AA41G2A8_9EURY|nr:helix-turn-helix transcriptional regulator [Haloarcula salina]MBV0903028.1 helix-turn-helix domain-containing protein [Haloarcula salina]